MAKDNNGLWVNPFSRKPQYKVYSKNGTFGRTYIKTDDQNKAYEMYEAAKIDKPDDHLELSKHERKGLLRKQEDSTLDVENDETTGEKLAEMRNNNALEKDRRREELLKKQHEMNTAGAIARQEASIKAHNDKVDHLFEKRGEHMDANYANKRMNTDYSSDEKVRETAAKESIKNQAYEERRKSDEAMRDKLKKERAEAMAKKDKEQAESIEKKGTSKDGMQQKELSKQENVANNSNTANENTNKGNASAEGTIKTSKPNTGKKGKTVKASVDTQVDSQPTHASNLEGYTFNGVSIAGTTVDDAKPVKKEKPVKSKGVKNNGKK